jgi:hypothetical protein
MNKNKRVQIEATMKPKTEVAVTPSIVAKRNPSNKILIILAIIFGALLICGLLAVIAIFSIRTYIDQKNIEISKLSNTITNQDNNVVDTNQTKLEVFTPYEGQKVNGKVIVKGQATASLKQLTILVYDNNAHLVGEGSISLTSTNPLDVISFSTEITLSDTPKSQNGLVYVYPTEVGEGSELMKVVGVEFETLTSDGRIVLYGPLANQSYDGTPVLFRGKMKGFFEGVMGIRLVLSNGGTFYNSIVQANGDNYTDFVYFEKTVELGDIPIAAGSTAKWELYETSMMDGSDTVLLSIPVILN